MLSGSNTDNRSFLMASNSLDWNTLRLVLAVARQGSFLAASKALNLHHATVSRQIDAVESHLGGKRLFDRTKQGTTLTTYGKEILIFAEVVEREFIRLETELGPSDETVGEIRLAMRTAISLWPLTCCLADFQADNPGITLQVLTEHQGFFDSEQGLAHLSLRFHEPIGEGVDILFSIGVAFAPYTETSAAKIAGDLPWVGFSGKFKGRGAERWMAENVDPTSISWRTDCFAHARAMAMTGRYRTVLPCTIGDGLPGLSRVGSTLPGVIDDFSIVSHRDALALSRVLRLSDFLVRCVEEKRDLIEGKVN